MIFQDPVTSLNPVLSIERQMTEGIESHLGVSHGEAVKRSIEMLRQVGIPRPRSASATTRTSSRAACASAS